jgi:thioredoxin-like negative regulator of GroEL
MSESREAEEEEDVDAFVFVESSNEVDDDDDGFVLTARTTIDDKNKEPMNVKEGQTINILETSNDVAEDPVAIFADTKRVDNFVVNHLKIKNPVLWSSVLVCLVLGGTLERVIMFQGNRSLQVKNTFDKNHELSAAGKMDLSSETTVSPDTDEYVNPASYYNVIKTPSLADPWDQKMNSEAKPPRIRPVLSIQGIPVPSHTDLWEEDLTNRPKVSTTGEPQNEISIDKADSIPHKWSVSVPVKSAMASVAIPTNGWNGDCQAVSLHAMHPVHVPARSLIPFATPRVAASHKKRLSVPSPSVVKRYPTTNYNGTSVQAEIVTSVDAEKIGAVPLFEVNSFDQHLQKHKDVFVAFLVPWSSHDRDLNHTWNEFTDLSRHKDLPFSVAVVDCSKSRVLCRAQNITKIPTLRWFRNARPSDYGNKNRTVENLLEYAEACFQARQRQQPPQTRSLWTRVESQNIENHTAPRKLPSLNLHYCISLTESNFHDSIRLHERVFVNFYIPNAAYGKIIAPLWNNFTRTILADNLPVVVAAVDCQSQRRLCKGQGLTRFPTMRWFENGEASLVENNGKRTVSDWIEYTQSMLSKLSNREKTNSSHGVADFRSLQEKAAFTAEQQVQSPPPASCHPEKLGGKPDSIKQKSVTAPDIPSKMIANRPGTSMSSSTNTGDENYIEYSNSF